MPSAPKAVGAASAQASSSSAARSLHSPRSEVSGCGMSRSIIAARALESGPSSVILSTSGAASEVGGTANVVTSPTAPPETPDAANRLCGQNASRPKALSIASAVQYAAFPPPPGAATRTSGTERLVVAPVIPARGSRHTSVSAARNWLVHDTNAASRSRVSLGESRWSSGTAIVLASW